MNILEINNLHKQFGGVYAVKSLTFAVKKNSITALIGPNGCGKTTAFNLITGFQKKDAGTIQYAQQDIPQQPHNVAQKGIARTFQHPRLFETLTVYEHLQLALNTDDDTLLSVFIREKNWLTEARQALEKVGFNNTLDTVAKDLSYGQRKLLDLAIALARKPKLLLLDEPVAGVNPQLRTQIREVIHTIHKEGTTILFIEHDMQFVGKIAQTVHVMNQGTLLTTGTPKEVRENPAVLEAYLGQ